MRVISEMQTLILAGEPVPQRFAYTTQPQPPLTLVATPVDEPMLIAASGQADISFAITPLPRGLVPPASFADRGNAHCAANAYARTQGLLSSGGRSAIIDTYA